MSTQFFNLLPLYIVLSYLNVYGLVFAVTESRSATRPHRGSGY